MKKPITIDNYKKLLFSKIICEYYAGPGDDKNVYDILMPINDDLTEVEESTIYFNQLLRKFDEIKKAEREDFIDYQVKKYRRHSKDWMYEVYDFLSEYDREINSGYPEMADKFKELIDVKLRRSPRSFASRLTWNSETFTDTDFLVLTKALFNIKAVVRIDGKKVTQKEIDQTLERFLNFGVPNKGKKLNSACITENNEKKKAFTLLLHEVWKQYVFDKLK